MAKPKLFKEISKISNVPEGSSVQEQLTSGSNIKTINSNYVLGSGDLTINSGKIDHVQVEGTEQTITDKTVNITKEALGLSAAMKLIGISTTEITDGGTEDPTIGGTVITTKNNGDVVIYNNNEFVWTNNCWNKLGDDSSYQLKINKIPGKILKQGASAGVIDEAVAGTDYQAPLTAGTDYVTPSSIKSVTFTVPVFTTSITITDLTGITADTVGIFGLATTATSAQYTAATDAQLLLTGQGTGTVTITAMAGSLSTAVPCVINIMK